MRSIRGNSAAAHDGAFYLIGGVALEPNASGRIFRLYLKDIWSYRPGAGWKRLADSPISMAAAPSPSPVINGRIFILPGDDGSKFGFQPPEQHPGFAPSILAYDVAANAWSKAGDSAAPHATLPCVEWRRGFVMPSGEVRPGFRSPQVWMMTPR